MFGKVRIAQAAAAVGIHDPDKIDLLVVNHHVEKWPGTKTGSSRMEENMRRVRRSRQKSARRDEVLGRRRYPGLPFCPSKQRNDRLNRQFLNQIDR